MKIGKGDGSKITKSTGLVTRVHTQLRKMKNTSSTILKRFKKSGDATDFETKTLDDIYKKNNGYIPPLNRKSYKGPK